MHDLSETPPDEWFEVIRAHYLVKQDGSNGYLLACRRCHQPRRIGPQPTAGRLFEALQHVHVCTGKQP